MTSPESVVTGYLAAADAALPGLLTRVHGYGSLALDDWHPGVSDVDLLVLTARPLDGPTLDALAGVHAALPEPPTLDVVYAPVDWTVELPDDQRATPYLLDGVLHRDEPCGNLTPVLWHCVARYGRVFRGPAPDWRVDPDRVRRYTLDNLRGYWQPAAGWGRATLAEADLAAPLPGDGVEWVALGPPRLHYTLATGNITSKSGAAAYVARHFPEYAELAARCAARRRGEPVQFTVGDRLAAADLADAVIEDAWNRWG